MPKRKRLADRHVLHEGADLVSDAKELITRMRQLLLADEDDDSPMRFRRSEIAVLDTLGAEGPIVMGQLAAPSAAAQHRDTDRESAGGRENGAA